MYFELYPSFLRIICSVPFTAVHYIKTGAFYQVFGDGYNLGVIVGVLKGHGFLSVLGLLHKGFEFCFSADGVFIRLSVSSMSWLVSLPYSHLEASKQSKTCYSCIRSMFFLSVG